MQIHRVICYCASIRAIPFNRVVGRSKTKHNRRPLHAPTGQDSSTDQRDVDRISATFPLTRGHSFVFKNMETCNPEKHSFHKLRGSVWTWAHVGSMIPEMLTNQYCWQQIFQIASYVLSPCAQMCGCRHYRRFIFLMKCWLMEIRRRIWA